MPDLESLKLKVEVESSSATSKLEGLSKSLKSLKTASSAMSTGVKVASKALGGIGTAASVTGKALKGVGSAVAKMKPSFKGLGMSLGDIKLKFVALVAILTKVVKGLASCAKQAMDFIETLNLFNVSMGDNAIAAGEFAEKVQQAMGIDMAEWMRNQGVFQTLIEGFGVASEKADIMSQQMTQLGYDLSSLFNMPFAESMQKLQSGIAGELEPLRRLGFDLSQAKLQQIAFDHGIRQTVSTMTQAQKVQLRYYAIMTQVTTAHGDMARTITQPANMLRIMKQNVVIASRAIGNLLIPVIQKLSAVAIIVARGIAKVANAIATLFGIDTNSWRDFVDDLNYTGGIDEGLEDVADGIDSTGNSAGRATDKIKEFQKQFLGFDKINNISLPKVDDGSGGGGGGGGSVGGGGDLDLPLPTYDFLQGIEDAFKDMHPRLAKLFEDLSEDIENGGNNIGTILGEAIRDALISIDWAGIEDTGNIIATKIANGLNQFLEVPGLFTTVGATLANALNVVFSTANTWAKAFHWDSLGTAVADTINAFFKTFKMSVAAATMSNIAIGIIDAIATAVGKTDFAQIAGSIASGLEAIKWKDIKASATTMATNIATGLNNLFSNDSLFKGIGGALAETVNTLLTMANTWAIEFDWTNLGKRIATTINTFFSTFDFKLTANTISNWAKGILDSAISAVNSTDWSQVGKKVAEFIGGIDWPGLVGKAIELAGMVIEGVADFTISFVKNIFSEILQWLYEVITGQKRADLNINFGASKDPEFTKAKNEYDSTNDKPATLTIGGKKDTTWAPVQKDFNDVTSKSANVKLTGSSTETFRKNHTKYEDIKKKSVNTNLTGSSTSLFRSNREKYNKLKDKSVKTTLKGSEAQTFKDLRYKYGNITPKTVQVTAKSSFDGNTNNLYKLMTMKNTRKFNFTATGNTMTLTPMTQANGGIFKNGKWRPVTAAAGGGLFNTGQMFIAREAGPELVGRIGSSTAVMNNNQIVSSVAAGVASANNAQNNLLRQLIQAVQSGDQTLILQVDSTRLGEVAIKSINKVQRQQGRTLLQV